MSTRRAAGGMIFREGADYDIPWTTNLLRSRWGGPTIVIHGEAIDVLTLPMLVAGEFEGLATYRLRGSEAELITLDAVEPGRRVGTHLLNELMERLSQQGIRQVWVTTTNDNLVALSFYQRRGFRLQRLHVGAVDQARLTKHIPLLGDNGIPIRDELDLCRDL